MTLKMLLNFLIFAFFAFSCNVAEKVAVQDREEAIESTEQERTFRFISQGIYVDEATSPTITIQRGIDQKWDTEYAYIEINGTADSSDYTSITQGGIDVTPLGNIITVTFLPGFTNAEIKINLNDDTVYESDERFFLTLLPELSGAISEVYSTHNVFINDNDTAPQPSFALSTSTVLEGNTKTITINLSNASAYDTQTRVVIYGGEATASDHSFSEQYISFPAGTTSATVGVLAYNDGINELDESLILEVRPSTGQDWASANTTHDLVIQEAGATPEFEFASTTYSGTESGVDVTVTLNFVGTFDQDLIVPFSVSGDALLNTDYTVSEEYFYLPLGSSSASITVTLKDDGTHEDTETFTMTVSDMPFAVAGTNSSSVFSITDLQATPPEIGFALPAYTTQEDALVYLPIELTYPAEDHMDVTFTVTPSATVTASDYYMPYTTTLPIPAGTQFTTLPIKIIKDSLFEGTETMDFTITAGTFSTLATVPSVSATYATTTLSIKETVDMPTINFTSGSYTVSEADGTFTATVELSEAADVDLDFTLAISGDASSATDYSALSNTHTITAGLTSYDITGTLTDDTTDEPRELIKLQIMQPQYMQLGDTNLALVQIEDDDTASQVTVSALGVTVAEGASESFEAVLDKASEHDLYIPVTFSSTAEEGVDFEASSDQFYIPAGDTSATILITATADGAYDGATSDTIQIDMATGSNYSLATPSTTMDIVDAEVAPGLNWVAASPITYTEGDNASLSIKLDHPTYTDLTVTIYISDDSDGAAACLPNCATIVAETGPSPATYFDTNLNTQLTTANTIDVVIPAGQTTATLNFDVLNDFRDDLVTESFELSTTAVSDGTAVSFVSSSLTINILDLQ